MVRSLINFAHYLYEVFLFISYFEHSALSFADDHQQRYKNRKCKTRLPLYWNKLHRLATHARTYSHNAHQLCSIQDALAAFSTSLALLIIITTTTFFIFPWHVLTWSLEFCQLFFRTPYFACYFWLPDYRYLQY